MKTWMAVLLLSVVAWCAFATTPFSAKIFHHDPYCLAVAFPCPDQNDGVLMIRSVSNTHLFSLEDLGIDPWSCSTTAGYDWYDNALGFASQIRIDSGNKMYWGWLFVLRLPDGKEVIINVHTGKIINEKDVSFERRTLQNKLETTILGQLSSRNPKDREAAAIQAGHLKMTNALPSLRGLLHDESHGVILTGGNRCVPHYYVRDAAAEAIQAITGKKPTTPEIEKPKKKQ